LLRKLLDRERFTFYPKQVKAAAWYELGVTPTLDRIFDGLPLIKKQVRSQGDRAGDAQKSVSTGRGRPPRCVDTIRARRRGRSSTSSGEHHYRPFLIASRLTFTVNV